VTFVICDYAMHCGEIAEVFCFLSVTARRALVEHIGYWYFFQSPIVLFNCYLTNAR